MWPPLQSTAAKRYTYARRTVRSLTLNNRAISGTARCSWSLIRRTSSLWADVRAGGLPPIRPRLRADAKPSFVRSEILSLSNCAMDAKTWNVRRPAGVVVSMSSAKDRNPAPRSPMVSTISRRSLRDRARRSYLVTVTTSPSRSWSSILSSSGRSRFDPLILSANSLPAPVAFSASVWASRFWSFVETRAYPMIMIHCDKNLPELQRFCRGFLS